MACDNCIQKYYNIFDFVYNLFAFNSEVFDSAQTDAPEQLYHSTKTLFITLSLSYTVA